MRRPPLQKHPAAAALPLGTGGSRAIGLTARAAPASAQITVFDPSNYAQSVLTAARTLQQVDQQIRQLQNEARMLADSARSLRTIDFPQLDALKAKLAEIDRLMGRAQAIDFDVDRLDEKFAALFPRDFSSALRSDARVRDAKARLDEIGRAHV